MTPDEGEEATACEEGEEDCWKGPFWGNSIIADGDFQAKVIKEAVCTEDSFPLTSSLSNSLLLTSVLLTWGEDIGTTLPSLVGGVKAPEEWRPI